jgi:hypothetical protein
VPLDNLGLCLVAVEVVVDAVAGVEGLAAAAGSLGAQCHPWDSLLLTSKHCRVSQPPCTLSETFFFLGVWMCPYSFAQEMDPLPVLTEFDDDERRSCQYQNDLIYRLRHSKYYIVEEEKKTGDYLSWDDWNFSENKTLHL